MLSLSKVCDSVISDRCWRIIHHFVLAYQRLHQIIYANTLTRSVCQDNLLITDSSKLPLKPNFLCVCVLFSSQTQGNSQKLHLQEKGGWRQLDKRSKRTIHVAHIPYLVKRLTLVKRDIQCHVTQTLLIEYCHKSHICRHDSCNCIVMQVLI